MLQKKYIATSPISYGFDGGRKSDSGEENWCFCIHIFYSFNLIEFIWSSAAASNGYRMADYGVRYGSLMLLLFDIDDFYNKDKH